MLLNSQAALIKETEMSPHKYILIRQPLDKNFCSEQWQQIKLKKPAAYARLQFKIFDELIKNEDMFSKYFQLFYENHIKLYHWYLLAREKQHQIQLYIFKKILRKTYQNYKDQVKRLQSQMIKQKEKQKENKSKFKNKQDLSSGEPKRKYKIDDLSHDIFNFMTTKTATASLQVQQKPWSFNRTRKHNKQNSFNSTTENYHGYQGSGLKNCTIQGGWMEQKRNISPKNKQELFKKIKNTFNKHDFHELYLQTFHACDGPRYIFYDYQKHMKGLSQKDKYNMFIRNNNKSKLMDIRFTEASQQQPYLKQIKSLSGDLMRSSYQFSPLGTAIQQEKKKSKSKVVFRKTRSKNCGKFVRK